MPTERELRDVLAEHPELLAGLPKHAAAVSARLDRVPRPCVSLRTREGKELCGYRFSQPVNVPFCIGAAEAASVRRLLHAHDPAAVAALLELGADLERLVAEAPAAAAVGEVDQVADLSVAPVGPHHRLPVLGFRVTP